MDECGVSGLFRPRFSHRVKPSDPGRAQHADFVGDRIVKGGVKFFRTSSSASQPGVDLERRHSMEHPSLDRRFGSLGFTSLICGEYQEHIFASELPLALQCSLHKHSSTTGRFCATTTYITRGGISKVPIHWWALAHSETVRYDTNKRDKRGCAGRKSREQAAKVGGIIECQDSSFKHRTS